VGRFASAASIRQIPRRDATRFVTDPRTKGGTAPLVYMPQLDGLRAIAVSAVVLEHFKILPGAAAYGVHLFFVLSGFLITGILLRSREAAAERGIRRTHAFRQFYIRRALRIFPLYYLVIAAALILDVQYARDYAPWLLTYTINLKMASQGWFINYFAHFWSLAVEEQYYLFWPWLILLLRRRWLIPVAVAMTTIGPLFRLYVLLSWVFMNSDSSGLSGYIATPTALDSLGMGSLVAILLSSEPGRRQIRRFMPVVVPLASFGVVLVMALWLPKPLNFVLYDTTTAVFFAWLIYSASKGFGGIAGRVLSAAPLVFIGRISYGVYVYHPLVPPATDSIAGRFGIALPTGMWGRFLAYTALTLVVAAISWYIVERPINGLKRHFEYDRPDEMPPAP
jgi:peptidoglycan/LPS O-acetylase OafA/YrhL